MLIWENKWAERIFYDKHWNASFIIAFSMRLSTYQSNPSLFTRCTQMCTEKSFCEKIPFYMPSSAFFKFSPKFKNFHSFQKTQTFVEKPFRHFILISILQQSWHLLPILKTITFFSQKGPVEIYYHFIRILRQICYNLVTRNFQTDPKSWIRATGNCNVINARGEWIIFRSYGNGGKE